MKSSSEIYCCPPRRCQTLIALGVDAGYKAKGKLSAPDLARKRVSGPGATLVELLDYAAGKVNPTP